MISVNFCKNDENHHPSLCDTPDVMMYHEITFCTANRPNTLYMKVLQKYCHWFVFTIKIPRDDLRRCSASLCNGQAPQRTGSDF